jgi:hypothetical protein
MIAALATLGLSAGVAGRSVFLGGSDEIGPSVLSLLASKQIDDRSVLEEALTIWSVPPPASNRAGHDRSTHALVSTVPRTEPRSTRTSSL